MNQFLLRTFVGALFVVLIIPAFPARAAISDVPCDTAALVAAVDAANGTPEPDTLNLAAACAYNFTAGEATNSDSALPRITTPITINGSGATIARTGGGSFRLFYVTNSGSLTLDDVTITGGSAPSGGGIYNEGPLTLTDSTITGNTATLYGGGIFNFSASAEMTIVSSTVSGNTAGSGGGGIFTYNDSTMDLIDSAISGNTSDNSGAENTDGGGILNQNATLTVVNSTITGNTADGDGGGIANVSSGVITIVSSTLSGNSSDHGGGIYSVGTADVFNSVVTGNFAATSTGGIMNGLSLTVHSSTISGNSFSGVNGTGTNVISNSILWGNESTYIFTAFITNSIVEGGFTGTGNLDDDPLFVAPQPFASAPTTTGDYRLQADSPALNVGSNAGLPDDTYDLDGDNDTGEAIPYDRDGNTRVVNATVDMGAYEHQIAAAVVLSETNVDVAEDGATDTYSVHLASRPSGDVTVTPAGDADCSVSAALNFTDADWDTPQTVTVTAIDDAIVEGEHGCTVTHTVASGDATYDGISVASVNATITDNDTLATDLLANGGFESALDGWTVKFKTGDKRTCKPGKALSGLCAFKFKGATGEKAQLSQTVDLTGVTLETGDLLSLSAWFKGNNAAAKTQMVLIVRYTGSPTPVQTKLKVKRNAAYAQHALPDYALTSGAVEEIKMTFKHKSTAGSVLIDDVSLIHTPGGARTRTGAPLPPPSAPEGFRGGS